MSKTYSKTSTNFFRPKNLPSLESPQIYSTHHPVLEYHLFPLIMNANTGINPDNILKNFYSKDMIKQIKKRNFYIPFDIKHPSNL